jgi:Family of unknown function (DUF6535)
MDNHGVTRNRHPLLDLALWSFLLALDSRNDKELAEDWVQDKDGILAFVRLISLLRIIKTNLFLFGKSGLFSLTVLVFIVGGNNNMLCSPLAANAHLLAQMSRDVIDMLHIGAQVTTPPSPMSYQPNVSIWINVLWSLSLMFGLVCTFFGIRLRRWAYHYLLISPRHDPHVPLRHRPSDTDEPASSRPSVMLGLLQIYLPLSIFLFYLGLVLFLVHVGISPGLLFVSSLVLVGTLYEFLFINV